MELWHEPEDADCGWQSDQHEPYAGHAAGRFDSRVQPAFAVLEAADDVAGGQCENTPCRSEGIFFRRANRRCQELKSRPADGSRHSACNIAFYDG